MKEGLLKKIGYTILCKSIVDIYGMILEPWEHKKHIYQTEEIAVEAVKWMDCNGPGLLSMFYRIVPVYIKE